MKNIPTKDFRVLGISPSNRGIAFAILEGRDSLVDWGIKTVTGDKNNQSIARLQQLIAHYDPGMIAFEDSSAKGSRRSSRIRKLGQKIVKLAGTRKLRVEAFSRHDLIKTFAPDSERTKYGVAKAIAERFPEELAVRLPPKRKPWESEDSRMNIFDAVAIALMPQVKNIKRRLSTLQR